MPFLLIYATFDSPRLQYVLQWIGEERLGIPFRLTDDKEAWLKHEGPKLNYSRAVLSEGELRIIPHALLQETGIRAQQPGINRWKHSTILFYNQPGAIIPFDLFAAVFYLISRYEEYLPYTPDKHGRFPHQASLAAQYAFLQQPVVDEWLLQLRHILEQRFGIAGTWPGFHFQPTYDVDIAWKYRYKGNRRIWGGYLKDLSRANLRAIAERKAVLSDRKKDPYDCFAWLDQLHREYHLEPIYFILLGRLSAYDKNADPESPGMQQLMRQLSEHYATGIHPSYGSHTESARLEEEIRILRHATQQVVTRSRQHYIKFTLPGTYEQLLATGIRDDHSMGYPSANGFRAGTSRSFLWYNLTLEQVTTLRVHPFVYMDATSRFYNKHSPQEAWLEWEQLWHAVKKVNGVFVSIAHNHLLGPARENKGWGEMYRKALEL